MKTITKEFFDKYRDRMNDGTIEPWVSKETANHIVWMMDEIPKMGEHEGKQMRWLGFVQGFFWSAGLFSIDEMRNDNR